MQKFALPVILLVVLLIYFPVLSAYFSHDDFFHFKASQTDGTLGAFINLFGFPTFEERGYGFYRPLTREGFFNIYYSLFGLNHIPARVFSLSIHFINIILVYLFIQKIFRRNNLSLFTAFFFGITAANVGSLYYLAGGIQSLIATNFMLLTLLLFPRKISFLTFVLALASHELASIIPVILLGFAFVKKTILKNIKLIVLFFVVLAIFIFLDIVHIGFSSGEGQYQPVFSPRVFVNSLSWYLLWSLGFPEMLIDFVGPRLSLNQNLMKFWGDYYSGIFLFGGISLIVIAVSIMYLLLQKKSIFSKKFWFIVLWFPVAIFPVILLPLHKQTYYLNPALPAFWSIVGFLVLGAYNHSIRKSKIVAGFLLGAFLAATFCLSLTAILLAGETYPAANRGRIAKRLINDVRGKYPTLPKGAVVYFKNDPDYPKISGDWGGSSKQAAFALNGNDALQLLYQDSTLVVIYEDSGLKIPSGNVYPFIAKISN